MESLHLNLPAKKFSLRKIILLFLLFAAAMIMLAEVLLYKSMRGWEPYDNLGLEMAGKAFVVLTTLIFMGEYYRTYISRPDEEYRILFESNPNPMWIFDLETLNFLVVNHGAVRQYGYSAKEFLSMTIKDIRPAEDVPKLLDRIEEVRNDVKREGLWRHIKKDGTVFFVEVSGFRIIYKGRPAELVVTRDVTRQIKTEIELETSNQNITALMNNTKDIIWSTDNDLKLVYFNSAFFDTMKATYLHEYSIGDPVFFDSMPEEKKHKWKSFYKRVLQGEPFTAEDEGMNEKGEKYFLEVGFNPIMSKSGEVVGTSCFVHDITRKKRVEHKARHMNRQYSILCKATNDAIWDWDLRNDFITWNHGVKTIFGYEEREVSYDVNWWSSNVHPEDYQRVWEEINTTFRDKKQNWTSTYRFKCQDGQYKYVFDRGYVIYENSQPVRMIGAIQDIDERTRATEEVKKLSLVASKTENSVIITNKIGEIEWVNDAFTLLTGYTSQEVLGQHPAKLLHGPNTDIEVTERITATLQQKKSVSEEIQIYSKSGKELWIKLSITPVLDQHGESCQHVSIQSDVTKHKEFEQHIISIASELSNLIENANAIIFGVDEYGRINEWNNVSAKITRFTKNEVLGKKLEDIIQIPRNCDLLTRLIDQGLEGHAVTNFEIPILTKDKKSKIILFNATARLSPLGKIVGVLAVGQDITELTEYRLSLEHKVQERTRELVQALAKEKELVQMRNKFVSMVSHEFKAPLSSINSSVTFIERNRNAHEKKGVEAKLESIKKNVNHMSLLLNDVLTIGRHNMKIAVENSPVNMHEFLSGLIMEVELSTKQTHSVEFEYKVPQAEIFTDEKLLRTIFSNLLTNAIKYSPDQTQIFLSVIGCSDKIYCEVKDFGLGISTEDQVRLFEPFYRGKNVGLIDGTGLGLSIVKRAVELIGGEIFYESKIGEGTTFKIALPV